jgi:hypothetical protein
VCLEKYRVGLKSNVKKTTSLTYAINEGEEMMLGPLGPRKIY